jgi:hypothetical protein
VVTLRDLNVWSKGKPGIGKLTMLGILLLLLVACVIAGMARKMRGGNCLPLPGSAGEHHFQDRTGDGGVSPATAA